MAKKCEIDRLSALPDNILTCNIFSHLTFIDVVRTSVLSRRWEFLWRRSPSLDFVGEIFESPDTISNILGLHCGHIQRFSFDLSIDGNKLKGLPVEEWIQCAAEKEVKHTALRSTYLAKLDVPSSLFSCHRLRVLELDNFSFRGIPTDFDGFPSLESCSLSHSDGLTDDGLKQLVGLCPLLHKLVLARCGQLINLKIQTSNLNSLKILDCNNLESLTANCPQLVELELEECIFLDEFRMNSCVLFHDLDTPDIEIPKESSMLNSLRKLSVKKCSIRTSLAHLSCFRNLEEVHIEVREQARGKMVAGSTFPSLKKVYVEYIEYEEEEADMVAILLNNAPVLNTITLILPFCPDNIHGKEFKNRVTDLQQIYEKVDIRIKIDEERLDKICWMAHVFYRE